MILEAAHLTVSPNKTSAFEAAMNEAKTIIASMPGFISMAVRPCCEAENQYLLEVRWQTLEDHTEGFRGSPQYQQWRALLHQFYEPFPDVFHYREPIISA